MKCIINSETGAYCVGAAVSIVYIFMIFDSLSGKRSGKTSAGRPTARLALCCSLSAILLLVSGILSYRAFCSSMIFELAFPAAFLAMFSSRRDCCTILPPDAAGVLLLAFTIVFLSVSYLLSGAFRHELSSYAPATVALLSVISLAVPVRALVSSPDGFIKGMSAKTCISDYVNLAVYILFLSFLMIAMTTFRLSGVAHSVAAGLCVIVLLFFHLLFYLRASRDRLFVLFPAVERSTVSGLRVSLFSVEEEKSRTEAGYEQIYARLETYFAEKKPFLESDLTIGDIARELYTNKLYISKVVRLYTGRNFCQYVNYHRVHYSMGLFKSDPHLKVSQLSSMSGFHTVASYNMAFRLFMNESPSEWCRRNRMIPE